MNDLTEEWVVQAESDCRVAIRESQVTEQPSLDAARVLASLPWRVLKIFKWNAWPAASKFRR